MALTRCWDSPFSTVWAEPTRKLYNEDLEDDGVRRTTCAASSGGLSEGGFSRACGGCSGVWLGGYPGLFGVVGLFMFVGVFFVVQSGGSGSVWSPRSSSFLLDTRGLIREVVGFSHFGSKTLLCLNGLDRGNQQLGLRLGYCLIRVSRLRV